MATKTPTQKPPRQKPREITEEERELMSDFEMRIWLVFLGLSSILTIIADVFGITVIGLPATFLFDVVPATVNIAYTVRIALLGQFTIWDGIVNIITLIVPFASFIKFYVKIKGFKDKAQAVLDKAKRPIQPVARTLSAGLLKRQAIQSQGFQGNIATKGRIAPEEEPQEKTGETTQTPPTIIEEVNEEILNPVEQETQTQILQTQPERPETTRKEEQSHSQQSSQPQEKQKGDVTTKEEELAAPTGETYFSPRPQEEYEKTIQNESREELVNEKTVVTSETPSEIPVEIPKKSISGIAVAGRRAPEKTAELRSNNTPLEEGFAPLQVIKEPEKEKPQEAEPIAIKVQPIPQVIQENQETPKTSGIGTTPQSPQAAPQILPRQPEAIDLSELSEQIAKIQENNQARKQNQEFETPKRGATLSEEKLFTADLTEPSIPTSQPSKEKKDEQAQVFNASLPVYEDIISTDQYQPTRKNTSTVNRGATPQQSVKITNKEQITPQNEPQPPEYVKDLENELGLGENNLGKITGEEGEEKKIVRITADEQRAQEETERTPEKPAKPTRVAQLEERFKENKKEAREQEKAALENTGTTTSQAPSKKIPEKQSEVAHIKDKIQAKKELEKQKEEEAKAQRIAVAEKKFAEDIANQDTGFEKQSTNVIDLRKKEEDIQGKDTFKKAA